MQYADQALIKRYSLSPSCSIGFLFKFDLTTKAMMQATKNPMIINIGNDTFYEAWVLAARLNSPPRKPSAY